MLTAFSRLGIYSRNFRRNSRFFKLDLCVKCQQSTKANPLLVDPEPEPHLVDMSLQWKALHQPIIDRTPPIPVYDTVNFRIRGFDYVVLERYQKYMHDVISALRLTVHDSWAAAARTSKAVTYKPRTTVTENEYNLSMYERNFQLSQLPSTKAQLLLEILQTNLPVGVELTFKYPDADDDAMRYLPDTQLHEKEKELEELINPKKSRQEALIETLASATVK